MKEAVRKDETQDCSSVQIELTVDETWIDNMLSAYPVDIPIGDKYTLTHLRIAIGDGLVHFHADLKEKENTSVGLTARPVWDAGLQQIRIEDLKLQTDTNNILLKSAGFFVKAFLTDTVDKKLEKQANKMFAEQLEKYKSQPVEIPIPKGGKARVILSDVTIHDLRLLDRSLWIRLTIDAHFQAHLT